MERLIPEEVEKQIIQILKKGNDVELKKINGQLVVVEITRKKRSKSPL